MCQITLNEAKNGIEVRFDRKPSRDVLDTLKGAGFRWSNRQKMWYAKQTDERLKLAKSFTGSEADVQIPAEVVGQPKVYDLWALTRTDNLVKQCPEKRLELKDISANIKKHLVKRFPMIKFSVTIHYTAINARVMSTPFAKGGPENEAIISYMEDYISTWKSSSHSSFYGGKHWTEMSYICDYREPTADETEISNLFRQKREVYLKEEEARKEEEYKEYMKKVEEDRVRYEQWRKQTDEDLKVINSNAVVQDCDPYFLLDVLFNGGKENTIDEYEEYLDDNLSHRRDCAIKRNVFFDGETYNLFTKHFLEDYPFIQGTGGNDTMDRRIKSMEDFDRMSAKERETVKWYGDNCVAIYCDNTLKLVVDAQGFGYCRYVGFIDELTHVGDYPVVMN